MIESILYFLTIAFLAFSIGKIARRYYKSSIFRTDDFYLLNSLIFLFFKYIADFYLFAVRYNISINIFSQILTAFAVLGYANFIISNIKMKNIMAYRFFRNTYFVAFVIVIGLISSGVFYSLNSGAAHIITNLYLINTAFESLNFSIILILIITYGAYSSLFKKKYFYPAGILVGISFFMAIVLNVVYRGYNPLLKAILMAVGQIGVIFSIHMILDFFRNREEIDLKDICPYGHSIFSQDVLSIEDAITYFRLEIQNHIQRKLDVTAKILKTITGDDEIKRFIDYEYKNITLHEMTIFSKQKTVVGDLGEIMFNAINWERFMTNVYKVALNDNLAIMDKLSKLKDVMDNITEKVVVPEILKIAKSKEHCSK